MPRSPSDARFGLLRMAWLTLAVVAAIWFAAAHWREVFAEPLDGRNLAIAFAFTIVGKIFAALQVRFTLSQAGEAIGLRSSLFAYSAADVAKYVPGGIWAVVGRIALYRELGMHGRLIFRALALEQVYLAGSAASIGAILYLAGRWGGPWPAFIAPVVLLGWGAVVLVCHRLYPPLPGGSRPLSLLAVQGMLWLFMGCGFAVLYAEHGYLATLAGAFCLAFAAGLMVPFAPGGIGVREAVAAALLYFLLSPIELTRMLLVSRCLLIVADLTFAIGVFAICRKAWREGVDAYREQLSRT